MITNSRSPVTFGPYEFDPRTGELRKGGIPIKLQPQPSRVLATLTERQGELVSREDLRREIWGDGTFVDSDQSLNFCIRQIRAALLDSAEAPRYLQTFPTQGYCFLQPVSRTPEVAGSGISTGSPAAARLQKFAESASNEGRKARSSLSAAFVLALSTVLLSSGLVAYSRQRAAEDPSRITSLLLLPLENQTGDPKQEYLASGLTESLLMDLNKISGLRVIGYRAPMQLTSAPRSVHDTARDLHVPAILEGSFGKTGNRVRVSGRLTDARTGASLWAGTYERDVQNLHGLEEEVAQEVSRHLRLRAREAEVAGSQVYRTTPGAYVPYLKAEYEWSSRSASGLQASIEDFKLATSADPGFAEPYAGLADAYVVMANLGFMPPAEAFVMADQATAQALRLNPAVAAAHAARATVCKVYYRDWTAAGKEYQEALRLDPHNARTRHGYADYLAIMNRPGEALREARRAKELDPLAPAVSSLLGFILFRAGRPGEAEEELRSAMETDSRFAPYHWLLGWTLDVQGQHSDSLRELEIAVRLSPGNPLFAGALGRAYAMAGDRQRAIRILSELQNSTDRNSARPYGIAKIYAGLEDRDRMFEWLLRAETARSEQIIRLAEDPDFSAFRSDARFDLLLSRMHLTNSGG